MKKLGCKIARTDKKIDLVGRKDDTLMAVFVTPKDNEEDLKPRIDELILDGFDKVETFPQKEIIKLKVQIERIKRKLELEGWKMIVLKPRPDFIAIENGWFTAVCLKIYYTNISRSHHVNAYQTRSWYKDLENRHLRQGFEHVTIFIHHKPRHKVHGDRIIIPVLNKQKTRLYRPVWLSGK